MKKKETKKKIEKNVKKYSLGIQNCMFKMTVDGEISIWARWKGRGVGKRARGRSMFDDYFRVKRTPIWTVQRNFFSNSYMFYLGSERRVRPTVNEHFEKLFILVPRYQCIKPEKTRIFGSILNSFLHYSEPGRVDQKIVFVSLLCLADKAYASWLKTVLLSFNHWNTKKAHGTNGFRRIWSTTQDFLLL